MKLLLFFALFALVVFGAVSTEKVLAQPTASDTFGFDTTEVTWSATTSVDCDALQTKALDKEELREDATAFAKRFVSLEFEYCKAKKKAQEKAGSTPTQNSKPAPKFVPVYEPEKWANSCVTKQGEFDAYGFHTLSTTDRTKATKPVTGTDTVNFSVFSRTQYYALTPHWTGNIDIPKDWDKDKFTEAAHRQGSKVDLVISNQDWFFEGGTDDIPGYKFDGLWLTKSYVLLTLIEDIAVAVEKYNFDGVTIDFRLPTDVATVQSYTFFIKRLKTRLKAGAESRGDNDLLEFGDKQLNIVIDEKFAISWAESYRVRAIRNGAIDSLSSEPNANSTQAFKTKVQRLTDSDWARLIKVQENATVGFTGSEPIGISELINNQTFEVDQAYIVTGLETLLAEINDQVDILFVDAKTEEYIDPTPISDAGKEASLTKNYEKLEVPIIGNQTDSGLIDSKKILGVWDVSNAEVKTKWDAGLNMKVFKSKNPGLEETRLGLVCTNRNTIAKTLAVLTPILALLVLVSWVFNGFPPRFKRSTSDLVIWGLVAVSFIAFILLLNSLPFRNFTSIYLFIILSAFVIPLLSLIWIFGNRIGEKTYP